ncbi:hypothetical protein FRB90_006199 [Tulasnella sp. 427]|nr:hypothetical protein FRB90_006199 [Tulasnella sp. 427]
MSSTSSSPQAPLDGSESQEGNAVNAELTDTDLLIRSTSIILYLLWPEIKHKPSRLGSNHSRRLDRLSLLFATGQSLDTSAISVAVHKDHVAVEVVKETTGSDMPPGFEAREDHTTQYMEYAESDHGTPLALLQDPIKFCIDRQDSAYINRSIDSISPSAYGAVLHKLLSKLHHVSSPPTQTSQELNILKEYVYCSCISKIRKRLTARSQDFHVEFLSLFLDPNGESAITPEELGEALRGFWVYGGKSIDEKWLFKKITAKYPEVNFGPAPVDGEKYEMDLNGNRAWCIWSYFVSYLEALRVAVRYVESHVTRTEAERTDRSSSDVDQGHRDTSNAPDPYQFIALLLQVVSSNLAVIYQFVYASGSFRRMLLSIGPILYRHIDIQYRSAGNAGSQQKYAKEDDESDYSDYDSDWDGGSEYRRRLPPLSLQSWNWLRKLTHWHQALHDISNVRTASSILRKDSEMKVRMGPRPIHQDKQAPLLKTIEHVVEKGQVDNTLDLLFKRAFQKWPDPNVAGLPPAARTLRKAGDDRSILKFWDNQVSSSSVHCEASLACELPGPVVRTAQRDRRRCCYSCFILLKEMRVKNASSSGKVYPYAPPPEILEEVKAKLLEKLEKRLRAVLTTYAHSGSNDPPPGSSIGAIESDHVDVGCGAVKKYILQARAEVLNRG